MMEYEKSLASTVSPPAASVRSFFHDSLSVFITKIVVILLTLFTMVILAKALGPEGRGVLRSAQPTSSSPCSPSPTKSLS